MFLFELKRYFNKNYKRCIIIAFCVLGASLYSLTNIPLLFLDKNMVLNLQNYIIGEFNSTQFIMFITFPILFSILVADLISADFDSGYINLILPRVKSRLNYIACKFFMVLFISVLFTALILIFKVVVALIIGMPFNGELYVYVFMMLKNNNILNIYLYTMLYFISGLTLIGMLTILISLYIKSAGVSIGIIVLIGFLHNVFYIMRWDSIALLPLSQYILGLHNEFAPFGIGSSYFTLKFSFVYMWVSILIIFIFILNKVKKHDIRRNI